MKRIIASTALAVLIIGLMWLVHSRSIVAVDDGTYLIEGEPNCGNLHQSIVKSGPPGHIGLADLGELFGFKYNATPDGYLSHTFVNEDLLWVVTNGPEDENNSVAITGTNAISVTWSATLGIDAVIVQGTPDAYAYVYVPEAYQGGSLVAPDSGEIQSVEFCYDYHLEAENKALESVDRDIDWTITKEGSGAYARFAGESLTHDYQVSVTKATTDTNLRVTGAITIYNPAPFDVFVDLTDTISDTANNTISAAVTCPDGGSTGTIKAAGSGGPGTLECSYTADADDGVDGDEALTRGVISVLSNTPYAIEGVTTTAPITFDTTYTGEPDVITVTDHHEDDVQFSESVSESTTWQYSTPFTCPDDPAPYSQGTYAMTDVNTATIVETGESVSQTVTLDCYAPLVDVDADTEWYDEYTWSIVKSVEPASHAGLTGDTFTSTYTVTVDQTVAPAGYRAFGTITVTNPHPELHMTVAVTDGIDGIPASITCDDLAPHLTVGPDTTGTCSYTVDLSDGADRTNTVTATLNSIAFAATANVSFGDPSVEGFPTIHVTDHFDPHGAAVVDPLGSASGDHTFTYTRTFECPTDEALYSDGVHQASFPNYASIDENGQQDNANVTVTCHRHPRIIVEKITDPAGTDQRFEFDASWRDTPLFVSGGESEDSGPLDPTIYAVTETVAAGWRLESATCSSTSGDQETPNTISLQAGETVTCTFINVSQPSYTFKASVNDQDADALAEAVEVEPGETLTFTYALINTGQIAITWETLTDTVSGDLTTPCGLPTIVDVGATVTCDRSAMAQEHEQEMETIAWVTVTGLDPQSDVAWYKISRASLDRFYVYLPLVQAGADRGDNALWVAMGKPLIAFEDVPGRWRHLALGRTCLR